MRTDVLNKRLRRLEGKRPDAQERLHQERLSRFFKQCTDEELDRFEEIVSRIEAGEAVSPADQEWHDNLLRDRGWFDEIV
jgi:hypothetical protein